MVFSATSQYSLVTPVVGVVSYQFVLMEYLPQHPLEEGELWQPWYGKIWFEFLEVCSEITALADTEASRAKNNARP